MKLLPMTARAASLTLSGSLAAVVGTVSSDVANSTTGAIALGSATSIRAACAYARHASSTTGAPIFALDVSMDAPTTDPAAVAHWVPVQLLDGSSFSAGSIDGYPEAIAAKPSATGTTSRGTPPWDVRGAHWARLRMADVDGTNPGAITGLTVGGEA
jgi:hypothetical protein